MTDKRLFPWLVLDMLVFITLNILIIKNINLPSNALSLFSPFKLLILGLAVYRGANIVSNEFVTKPIRSHFVVEKEVGGEVIEVPLSTGFRGFIGLLLYCPSCTGVWIAAIILYSYLLWPTPTSVIVLLLSLSGLERFFAYTFGRIKSNY